MEIKNVRITIEFERHREGEEVYYETLKLDPAELKEVEEFGYEIKDEYKEVWDNFNIQKLFRTARLIGHRMGFPSKDVKKIKYVK